MKEFLTAMSGPLAVVGWCLMFVGFWNLLRWLQHLTDFDTDHENDL